MLKNFWPRDRQLSSANVLKLTDHIPNTITGYCVSPPKSRPFCNALIDENRTEQLSNIITRLVGWLIGFYLQGPRNWIFVSSKAHVSRPTHILGDQDDPLVVRPGSWTQATCAEGEKPNRCPTDLTKQYTGSKCRNEVKMKMLSKIRPSLRIYSNPGPHY